MREIPLIYYFSQPYYLTEIFYKYYNPLMKEDGFAQTYYDASNKAIGSERFHDVIRSVYDYVQNMGLAADKMAHQVYPMLSYLQDFNHVTTIATLATIAAYSIKGANAMRDEFIEECLEEEQRDQNIALKERSKIFSEKIEDMVVYDYRRDNNMYYDEHQANRTEMRMLKKESSR